MIEKNWQELQRPEKISVTSSEYNPRQAVITVAPLERGFGITLGNSLRRILLSSLQGAAVTAVQIQGVVHEFSSIAGVREDVTDLILNIKGVAVSMDQKAHTQSSFGSRRSISGNSWYDFRISWY